MAEENDVIILDNGDKMTGEIRKLDRGMLEFKPDRINVIQIEWVRVDFLYSPDQFDLNLESGVRIVGALEKAEEKGRLVVVSEGGQITLDMITVVAMYPLHVRFWKRLRGYLDVGLSYQRAQEKVEWKLGGEVTYRGERWMYKLDSSSYFSQQENIEGTTRNNAQLTARRILKNRWIVGFLTTHEQNDELNLDYRALLGGVFGRFLVQSNRNFLLVSAGLTGTREKYSDSEDIGYNAEALLSVWYEAYKYVSPKLTFATTLTVFPSLTSRGRVRTNFSARLSYEIFSDFFLSLNGFYNYDNHPPGEEARKHDYAIDTTITWTF